MRRVNSGLRQFVTLYEPHALSLSEYLKMPLPRWVPEPKPNDPWNRVAGLRRDAALAVPEDPLRDVTRHVSEHSTASHSEEGY